MGAALKAHGERLRAENTDSAWLVDGTPENDDEEKKAGVPDNDCINV
jgi:hypothetical protein